MTILKSVTNLVGGVGLFSDCKFIVFSSVCLQRNKTVESMLLPKARRDLEVAVEEWAVTHPDDPILVCGRDPVSFVDFTVNEHLATKEQERKEKVRSTPTCRVANRGGHLGRAECTSQRVGKNRRCQQNRKRGVCSDTHTLAASVFTHALRGTFCLPCIPPGVHL
jgi:hypothetical protein